MVTPSLISSWALEMHNSNLRIKGQAMLKYEKQISGYFPYIFLKASANVYPSCGERKCASSIASIISRGRPLFHYIAFSISIYHVKILNCFYYIRRKACTPLYTIICNKSFCHFSFHNKGLSCKMDIIPPSNSHTYV